MGFIRATVGDTRGRRHSVIITLAATMAVGSSALAIPYNYVNIADTQVGSFSTFSLSCTMNNSGVVAFKGTYTGGATGIFVGSGGPVSTIATDAGPLAPLFATVQPAINDVGQVAFQCGLDASGEGIFRGNGGPLTTIAQTGASFQSFSTLDVSVNNSGMVAFQGRKPTSGIVGTYTGNGGAVTTIADTSGPLVAGIFTNAFHPSINNSGTVAFFAGFTGANQDSGVFTGTGGPYNTLYTSVGAPFAGFTSYPSINNIGSIAFETVLDNNQDAVYVGNGGAPSPFVTSAGPYLNFNNGNPSINDNGDVSFRAFLDSGGGGIYTGPNPVTDAVVVVGQTLFGRTVQDIFTTDQSLNNAGQICFRVIFTDGTRAIVRADPVPEPTSVVTFALGAAGLLLRRKRSRAATAPNASE